MGAHRGKRSQPILAALVGLWAGLAYAQTYEFMPDVPLSEPMESHEGVTLDFCSQWNPEFAYRGSLCCGAKRVPASVGRRGRRGLTSRCSPQRVKWSYCDEMTEEQRKYTTTVQNGEIPDLLEYLKGTIGSRGSQSFCTPDNGFLANGRRVVPTPQNRIQIRFPERCIDFGTDEMATMLEWVGRKIASAYNKPEFSKTRLLIGHVSAPRGGCISGRGGRRGHKSHTTGVDADIAFFNPMPNVASEETFSKYFDARTNFWLLKQIFDNPFACVKVVFLDRRLIKELREEVGTDPRWKELSPFIRHVSGHKNHFHVRIGEMPGEPGCQTDPNLEEDDEPIDFSDSPTAADEEP